MRNPIRIAIILIVAAIASTPATAKDFWEKCGERMVENYAVKAGEGMAPGMSQRLTSKQVASIATKSFSQSFGERFSEIANDKQLLALVCVFSKEGERCLLDPVMKDIFGEIHFVNEPGFSQKFIKKMSRFYTGPSKSRDSKSDRIKRSGSVKPHKKFNPRFGFVMNDFEPVVSSPFYTFGNIYVEPVYGLRKGASLGLMKDDWFIDLYSDRATIKYSFKNKFAGVKLYGKIMPSITYSTNGEITVQNTVFNW